MKKYIAILLMPTVFGLSMAGLTSCGTTGTSIAGGISSAQNWLSNPANQQLISTIASTAISLIGSLGKHGAAPSTATVVNRLAISYPDVPAGALVTIAKNPYQYVKSS